MASHVGFDQSLSEREGRSRKAQLFGQSALPAWYRAWFLLPVLVISYFSIGLAFPFNNLYGLPPYLTGGWDWGGGNVFTYGKIYLWGALALGSLANAWSVRKLRDEPVSKAIGILHSWNAPHLIFFFVFLIPLLLISELDKTGRDLLRQSAFFLACSVLVLIPTLALSRRWPLWIAIPLPLLLAIAWGFVPLGITPPWK